jgi:small multidrug resistance pump
MSYVYLLLAIAAEVIATSALKASEGFTKLWPTVAVALGYTIAFWFLSIVVQRMPVGIVYAIWSGAGIVLVSIVAAVWLKQIPDLAAIVGMTLIMAGVIIVNLFSKTATH